MQKKSASPFKGGGASKTPERTMAKNSTDKKVLVARWDLPLLREGGTTPTKGGEKQQSKSKWEIDESGNKRGFDEEGELIFEQKKVAVEPKSPLLKLVKESSFFMKIQKAE